MDEKEKTKGETEKIIITNNKKKNQGKTHTSSFSSNAFLCITDFEKHKCKTESAESFKKLTKTLSKISKFIISANFFTGIFRGFFTWSHQHRNQQLKYSHWNIFFHRRKQWFQKRLGGFGDEKERYLCKNSPQQVVFKWGMLSLTKRI